MKLVVGISGATGAIYGIRLLEVLRNVPDMESHLVISDAARRTIEHETDWTMQEVQALATEVYDNADIGAAIASGSFRVDGMVIAPCSIKTMSALANSYNTNLMTRAGDVTLKERRPLVLVVRETPLHYGHLKQMLDLAQTGAILLPPVPAYYHKPKTLDDIINHTVGKILDCFRIEHHLFMRWKGMPAPSGVKSG
ncbi:MAG: UbiX family flavin prenyltransferase [Dehalococcoidia bacterium]|nr:UbiX family flavin prenyltransferase [Dehalococcoidia bacterium]